MSQSHYLLSNKLKHWCYRETKWKALVVLERREKGGRDGTEARNTMYETLYPNPQYISTTFRTFLGSHFSKAKSEHFTKFSSSRDGKRATYSKNDRLEKEEDCAQNKWGSWGPCSRMKRKSKRGKPFNRFPVCGLLTVSVLYLFSVLLTDSFSPLSLPHH